MSDFVLEGPRWGSSAMGNSAGVVTWAFDNSVPAIFSASVESAFADWSAFGNILFQEVSSSADADITLSDNYIDGLNNVLGRTSYSYSNQSFVSASISFDSGEEWHASGNEVVSDSGVNLFFVALHEIGHAIGLNHYDGVPAVMNTYLNNGVLDLTQSEVHGVQALYGTSPLNGLWQGTAAEDVLLGTALDNVLAGHSGDDTLYGGDGADVLYGNLDNDALFGNLGNDTLFGGQSADVIYGNVGLDLLYGNLGDDVLYGGQGNDTLYGGQGSDSLLGGLGTNLLIGGLGADVFDMSRNPAQDTISDFSPLDGDRIELGTLSFNIGTDQNGSALLSLSNGGTLDLLGVTPDQLTETWAI